MTEKKKLEADKIRIATLMLTLEEFNNTINELRPTVDAMAKLLRKVLTDR